MLGCWCTGEGVVDGSPRGGYNCAWTLHGVVLQGSLAIRYQPYPKCSPGVAMEQNKLQRSAGGHLFATSAAGAVVVSALMHTSNVNSCGGLV